MYHIQVPQYYINKRYQKLFDNLTTRRQMIPLGLYRTTKVNLMSYNDLDVSKSRKKGVLSSNMKHIDSSNFKLVQYVVTNPDKDTRLEKDDLVFVLAK